MLNTREVGVRRSRVRCGQCWCCVTAASGREESARTAHKRAGADARTSAPDDRAGNLARTLTKRACRASAPGGTLPALPVIAERWQLRRAEMVKVMFSISLLRPGLVVAFVLSTSAAGAQTHVPTPSAAQEQLTCRPTVLRSAGYRDMLARLPERRAAHDSSSAARMVTSYRDAKQRHPQAPARTAVAGRDVTPQRYALRSRPSCG